MSTQIINNNFTGEKELYSEKVIIIIIFFAIFLPQFTVPTSISRCGKEQLF